MHSIINIEYDCVCDYFVLNPLPGTKNCIRN